MILKPARKSEWSALASSPAGLPNVMADALNRASGEVYTGVLAGRAGRIVRRKGLWLSEKAGTRWSDRSTYQAPLHAHSIDAAQQGFYKACAVARAVRKAGSPDVRFPYHRRRFRTTVWKNTGIRRKGDALILSNGRGNRPIAIALPAELRDACASWKSGWSTINERGRYAWHIVIEDGKAPKAAPGTNVVSVDLGEVHPAVVGDEAEATIITCRERRAESQGHARRRANIDRALARKKKGSKRHRRLVRRQGPPEGQARAGHAGHGAQDQPGRGRCRGRAQGRDDRHRRRPRRG